MKLSIKNMVCQRCIMVVKQELEKNKLTAETVQLGEIIFKEEPSEDQLTALKQGLTAHGFEVLDDRKAMIIEKVKNIIVTIIHSTDEVNLKRNFSDIIAQQIPVDYNYISSIFSTTEGITIEQFIILQRIERVKELLVYNELSLSEIAYKLGYSNVQHLSTQFKKITGLTPSHFKSVKENKRKSLDQL
ncbi:AraC family transcriptional regulator [Flavobacterium silvisoli]|uniref:AraC family transcriptional regulator n=1 Tax=Flavobacterium silvisoli TaxID=2529433 RepID=A0A4Q9Z6S2_9FLAO|nr:helix-turn-helix transcriptional regulator [Flavobacterium silvisoli]TBX70317.1 AraC family transcriptional regulator [Flavobacterium silvisoli]